MTENTADRELQEKIEDWLDNDAHSNRLPVKFNFSDIQKVAELLTPRILNLIEAEVKAGMLRQRAYDERKIEAERREARKQGYDPHLLGSWVFIGDNARLSNLDDLYWSYVTEYMAEQDPHRPDSIYGNTDYLKKNMASAGFNKVGLHKLLAKADQRARDRIAELETNLTTEEGKE